MHSPNIQKILRLFILAAIVLQFTGCATAPKLSSRKQERIAAYQALPPDQQAAVDQGRIKAGMNTDAVYIAWGNPSQIVAGGNSSGETTTWYYEGGYVDQQRYWGPTRLHYFYTPRSYMRAQVVFINGVVKEWQTFPEPVY